MPLRDSPAQGVVYALFRNREDALVGEEQLFDSALGRGVSAVRRVTLERGTVKGGDSALQASARVLSWFGQTCSHSRCRSTAVLGMCRKRRRLPAWAGGVGLAEGAGRSQATWPLSLCFCCSRICLQSDNAAGSMAARGLHLVPVGLHGEDAFTGSILVTGSSGMPCSAASCLEAHCDGGRVVVKPGSTRRERLVRDWWGRQSSATAIRHMQHHMNTHEHPLLSYHCHGIIHRFDIRFLDSATTVHTSSPPYMQILPMRKPTTPHISTKATRSTDESPWLAAMDRSKMQMGLLTLREYAGRG